MLRKGTMLLSMSLGKGTKNIKWLPNKIPTSQQQHIHGMSLSMFTTAKKLVQKMEVGDMTNILFHNLKNVIKIYIVLRHSPSKKV